MDAVPPDDSGDSGQRGQEEVGGWVLGLRPAAAPADQLRRPDLPPPEDVEEAPEDPVEVKHGLGRPGPNGTEALMVGHQAVNLASPETVGSIPTRPT